jgi:uncharacterized RDD family membrane protein YckC
MEVSPRDGGHELASWPRRAAALLLDAAILGLVIAGTLLASGIPAEEIRERLEGGETMLVVLLFVVPEAIYQTAMIGSRNQTLGKMALGIAVLDADNRAPIGYARAFTRWLSTAALRALFTIPSVIDHLWPLRDRRRQALHDKFARSVVVRR